MKMLPRMMLALTLALGLCLGGNARAQTPTTRLNIATLAPEGSSWMKLFHVWAKNIEKRAPGLKVRFYSGGVAGDERDAVRKMRLGQLDGAAVTAIGLGLIQPQVRVLELPFLFKNDAELDGVRSTLNDEFHKLFEEKGYVLLSWGDVGPVHLFTNTPVTSRADLNQLKLWAWTDDPLVRTLFQQVGLSGVPLGVPDVLPSLQTGLINACYGSPLSTLALQWSTKVKYATSMVLSQAIGATVLTKKSWDGLKPEWQQVVKEESAKLEKALLKRIRQDNVAALKRMQEQGLQVVPTPAAVQDEFLKESKVVAKKLEGKVYTHDFRVKVEQLVAAERAAGK